MLLFTSISFQHDAHDALLELSIPVSDDLAVCFRSLWLHQLTTGQSVQLLHDARFASYSVLAVSPDGLWVLLGSVTGWLRVLTTQGGGVDGEGEDRHCIDSQP